MHTFARTKSSIFGMFVALLILMIAAAPPARAGFSLGGGSNFAALYEGNGGNTLNFNNSCVTGNIGVGGTGKFGGSNGAACSGPDGTGTYIFGDLDFSQANVGQATGVGVHDITKVDVTGSINYSDDPTVSGALSDVNTLSQYEGGVTGQSTAIADGGSLNLDASGQCLDTDKYGDCVYTVSSVGTNNQKTYTITGKASDYVVFNIGFDAAFNGQIVLAGGITSDHVLFNFTAGNYTTLSGGSNLTISTNCETDGCGATGVFLDPNGKYQINHSDLDGRIFGGDSTDSAIVSGAFINAPPSVPEPTSILLLGTVLAFTGKLVRRRLSQKS